MKSLPGVLLSLLLSLAAIGRAGELAPARAADQTPFKAALEKHLQAKLREELVDQGLERRLRSAKLAERGIAPQLLDEFVAQSDKAKGWKELRRQFTAGGLNLPWIDKLLTDDLPAERQLERQKQLLDAGFTEELVAQLFETGRAARRGAELRKHLLAKGIEEQLLNELLEPPVPMRVEVRGFDTLEPKGDRATGCARVAMVEGDRVAEGTWNVTFEYAAIEEGVHTWRVAEVGVPPPKFGALNYAVVALYLLGMLAIGWWTSRSISGTRSFFIASGQMNYIVVGISLLTTYLSALTMMALSGVAFCKADMIWSIQLPFLILTAFVITRFVLQRYRDAGVISVYEYLEQRIHVSSRLLASLCFILFSIGRMGLVLFLPALAFHIITGFSLPWTIVVMGAVVTLYTVMGGMEAVIWTDFAQAIVILAGALVSVAYVLGGTGPTEFAQIAQQHHKFRLIAPGTDLTRLLTIWLILQTIFETIRIYGTQQDMTQRYMTTSSARKANQSVWIGILAYIPLGFLFYFIGAALFVYYKAHPDPAIPALIVNGRADAIYPYFVASKMPPGLAGLVIAAIFAAAMSSIDACMNASSAVCVEDFYRRFRGRDQSDRHHLNVARALTLVWGLLATLMALSFMDIKYAQHVWSKIMGISTNGVLGLMALAFLPWRVNRWAAVVGFLTSYLTLFTIMWFLQVKGGLAFTYPLPAGTGIHFLLWPVIGNVVCFGVALLADALLRRSGRART
jgi:SSS family solute:Na+ symporter